MKIQMYSISMYVFVFNSFHSGLAVEPNNADNQSASSARDSILSSIRANASEATADEMSQPPRRTITLYRSSFTVDNGPERRLDDPENADFLKDLARGVVPKELQGGEDPSVGLMDKRHVEYADDAGGGGGDDGDGPAAAPARSFAGEGQSLGSQSVVNSGGVISPTEATEPQVDESKPTTVIQIRLLNGKRLRVKINKCSTVMVLVEHINASGDAGGEDYALSAGFPPKILEDLKLTIEECGLAGSQVIQKKA
jgi:UBX domain-containing protein 1